MNRNFMKRFVLSLLVGILAVVNSFALEQITEENYSTYGFTAEQLATYEGSYIITNAAQLQQFSSMVNSGKTNINAILTNDIDMTGVTNWTPIGNADNKYMGKFDGLNHRIKNLIIDTDEDYQGLFGMTATGLVLNGVTIDKTCSIKGGNYVAAFVGDGSGTITNSGNEANVIGTDYTAGFVGSGNVTIRNCYNAGTVNSENNGAAFLGNSTSGISRCYNIGIVNCQNEKKFANSTSTSLSISFQLDSFSSQDYITTISNTTVESGSLCHKLNESLVEGDYEWRQTIGEQSYPTFDASQGKVYASEPCHIEFSNSPIEHTVEHISENGFCSVCNGYESAIVVTAENREMLQLGEEYIGYYAVGNAGQLYWIADLINQQNEQNIVLIDDIVVNEKVLESDGSLVEDVLNLRPWKPMLCDEQWNVVCVLDGNKHTISGLYCKMLGKAAGLFGGLYQSTIQDLGIVDSYFEGTQVGAFCGGENWECSISRCYNESTCVGTNEVGGIVSRAGGVTISNCYI